MLLVFFFLRFLSFFSSGRSYILLGTVVKDDILRFKCQICVICGCTKRGPGDLTDTGEQVGW